MRMLVAWDGSGHGLAALRDIVPLMRAQALANIEILLVVWPQRANAMWSDIREQQLIRDDIHRAAAEIAINDAEQLQTILAPLAKTMSTTIADGEVAQVIQDSIHRADAELLLLLVGHYDPGGLIAETLQELVRTSPIPTLILHPAGRLAL
jgi:nucleotide-binding universal stress UspA family protein